MKKLNRISVGAVIAGALAVLSAVSHTTAATRDFLWKISSQQGQIYLVGSVHMLTKDYYPLSGALDAAFKDSNLLVEEVDLAQMEGADALLMLATRGMLPEDQSLDKVLSVSTYAQVTRRMGNIGIPVEALSRLKPWMLALTFMTVEYQKAGFDPNLGLDKHFYDRARGDGKEVQGLETVEYQLSLFDSMTMEQQDRMLADTLKGLDTELTNVNKIADAWKAGDAPTIERILLADLKQDPVMYRRLLVDRNQSWLPKLEALFKRRGHAFVVVGAAHLVGSDGLLAMLKAKGCSIEQL